MACRREAALKEAKKRLHGTSNIFLVTPLREAPILFALGIITVIVQIACLASVHASIIYAEDTFLRIKAVQNTSRSFIRIQSDNGTIISGRVEFSSPLSSKYTDAIRVGDALEPCYTYTYEDWEGEEYKETIPCYDKPGHEQFELDAAHFQDWESTLEDEQELLNTGFKSSPGYLLFGQLMMFVLMVLWVARDLLTGLWLLYKGFFVCGLGLVVTSSYAILSSATFVYTNAVIFQRELGHDFLLGSVTVMLILELDTKTYEVAEGLLYFKPPKSPAAKPEEEAV